MNNPILVYRGNYVESTHEIHVAVVNKEGKLIYSYGDPTRMTFPRSSMKPFQAIPIIETGAAKALAFTQAELAITCASHAGEAEHRETVLHLLSKMGLQEEHLQCGTHLPWDLTSYKSLLREGKDVTPIFSNCSGKHSGMLATAVYMKEEIDTYREIEHPVQQRILKAIEKVCSFKKEAINLSVDGCGVPVHQLPLYNVALGFARLASPDQYDSAYVEILREIRDSMMNFPHMVGGTRRFDTDLMNVYQNRIVSKTGAEAVQCMGLVEEGYGIAIKVEDGSTRAVNVASMEVLRQLGYKEEKLFNELAKYVQAPVLNARREEIGKIIPQFTLKVHT